MADEGKREATRIFISYRRADARGYAGRLEDSLAHYFGAGRVFRDVGDIAPGEDFTSTISTSLGETGALVVLIGPDWLSAGEPGSRRLDAPDDLVAAEIATALEDDTPVFPVLVEGARMPSAEDLPERLEPLSRRNAITISDERWAADVTRLAKVIALDVSGSVLERRLTLAKTALMLVLCSSVVFTTLSFGRMAAATSVPMARTLHEGTTGGVRQDSEVDWFMAGEASVNFLAIVLTAVVLVGLRTWVTRRSRTFVWAAAIVGLLGTFASFLYYTLNAGGTYHEIRHVVVFCASTTIITLMLALMTLSGFVPNDSIE